MEAMEILYDKRDHIPASLAGVPEVRLVRLIFRLPDDNRIGMAATGIAETHLNISAHPCQPVDPVS